MWITSAFAPETGKDVFRSSDRNRACGSRAYISGLWNGRRSVADGRCRLRTWNSGVAVPPDNGRELLYGDGEELHGGLSGKCMSPQV